MAWEKKWCTWNFKIILEETVQIHINEDRKEILEIEHGYTKACGINIKLPSLS